MKKLILLFLLTPVLLFSQPQFTITDLNGDTWDSNELLESGITIVIQFFSPSMTCWPSSNSIELFTEAYSEYGLCQNKLFFLQVAEWGLYSTTLNFIDEFGTTEISTLAGISGGEDLTYEWMEWGLQWAYELWLLRPDGTYEYDIPYAWDLEQQVLINLLENEGFSACEYNVEIEEYNIENNDKTIYDIMGRIIDNPTQGFYIQGNKKHYIIK